MQPEVKVDNKEAEKQSQQQPQNTQAQNNPQSEQPKETDKDINWNKFKEARAKEREQLEIATKEKIKSQQEAAALKAALEAVVNKPNIPQQQYNQDYEQQEETEDQRIERKVQAAIESRDKAYQQQRQAKEHAEYPQRLVSDHADFNQVCNTENLDYLDYHYPEVSNAFKHVPDGYEKWSAVYKAVKRFVPNTDTRRDMAKADRNLSKPQSMSAAGVSQNTTAGTVKLDKARKEANYERMQRTIKGLSN